MNLRIGIDFDNTLANYERVFSKAAIDLDVISSDWKGGKKELRDHIRTLDNGETIWQKLQGKVYGKFMKDAELYPGVSEFLWKCKLSKTEVFIVSHKTIFGHFDEEKINLRSVASDWMQAQGFFRDSEYSIKNENVFFAETRSEKIQKINSLNLDFFIDDLIEVFVEDEFNLHTKKILFSNSIHHEYSNFDGVVLQSWRKILGHIFQNLNEIDIQKILSEKWTDLQGSELKLIKANGNSRVFQLGNLSNSYLLKIYPDLQFDNRKRLHVEFSSSEKLYRSGVNVPLPVYLDENLNWGLYSWIEGSAIDEVNEQLILKLIDIVISLKKISEESKLDSNFQASEACLCPSDIEKQIQHRLLALKVVEHSDLQEFLSIEFEPVYESNLANIKKHFKNNYNSTLNQEYRILSPSDFGFHNAKLNSNGELYIFDLEYFGWDDPVKLIADFVWHPAMKISQTLKNLWIEKTIELFSQDPDIGIRFELYKPMIGLRWVLIILNEFLKKKLENRTNANPDKTANLNIIQNEQLRKAKQLLSEI